MRPSSARSARSTRSTKSARSARPQAAVKSRPDLIRLHPANPVQGLQTEFNAPNKVFFAKRNPYYPPASETLAPPPPLDDPAYRYDDYIPPTSGSIAVQVSVY